MTDNQMLDALVFFLAQIDDIMTKGRMNHSDYQKRKIGFDTE